MVPRAIAEGLTGGRSEQESLLVAIQYPWRLESQIERSSSFGLGKIGFRAAPDHI
jgi:hypothetical protein